MRDPRLFTALAAPATLLGWLFVVSAVPARGADDSAADVRLRAMERVARTISIAEIQGQMSLQAELIPEPLLRFNDPDRGISDGTLWAWGTIGRPLALLEVYQKPDVSSCYCAISTASPHAIEAAAEGVVFWKPKPPGVTLRELPDMPLPSDDKRIRLRQIKHAAARFSAFELFDPDRQRSQLRLLPQPLHRYSNAETGLQDGAFFVFALGTNPEVILFVESHETDQGSFQWKYGLVRRGFAELHVALDGHTVWSVPRAWESKPDDSMFAFIDRP